MCHFVPPCFGFATFHHQPDELSPRGSFCFWLPSSFLIYFIFPVFFLLKAHDSACCRDPSSFTLFSSKREILPPLAQKPAIKALNGWNLGWKVVWIALKLSIEKDQAWQAAGVLQDCQDAIKRCRSSAFHAATSPHQPRFWQTIGFKADAIRQKQAQRMAFAAPFPHFRCKSKTGHEDWFYLKCFLGVYFLAFIRPTLNLFGI